MTRYGWPSQAPKGHRQRGAGAVVKSKGEIAVGGLVIKEWQRTPMQLLQEYCQGEKRPKPRYDSMRAREGDPPGHSRVRAVLQDPKKPGSDKDLIFMATQSFPTSTEAKHSVALLALGRLCPTHPLERKLPAPYDALWTAMIASAAGTSKASDTKGGSAPKKTKQAKALPSAPAAATPASSFAASWEAEAMPAIPPVGAKEESVPVLTMLNRYESAAAKKRVMADRDQQRRERQNKREARKVLDPNKPPRVLMSETMRTEIEAFLKRQLASSSSGGGDGVSAEETEECLAHLERLGFARNRIEQAIAQVRAPSDLQMQVLDWLCLHLPEDELPKAFDPRSKGVRLVKGSGGSGPTADLCAKGFHAADAMSALHRVDGDAWAAGALLLSEALLLVSDELGDTEGRCWWPPRDEEAEEDPDERVIHDELELLQSIYGEENVTVTDLECTVPSRTGSDVALLGPTPFKRVELPLPCSCQLIALLPVAGEGLQYPVASPLVFVEMSIPKFASSRLEDLAKLSLVAATEAMVTVLEHKGTPCLHAARESAASTLETLLGSDALAETTRLRSPLCEQHSRLIRPLLPLPVAEADDLEMAASAAASASPPKRATHSLGRSPSRLRNVPKALKAAYSELDAVLKGRPKCAKFSKSRERLPIWAERDAILRTVRENQVVLLRGETGCGKSTQLPQFLLEEACERGEGGRTHILVTQPRRLAAIGVARRVAEERGESLSDGSRGELASHCTVGYHIRGEKRCSALTNVTFCTTGILLRRLQSGLDRGVTHIVVDEVHERSVDTDFLLLILRRVARVNPSVKVVLMSATIDAGKICEYFSSFLGKPCPVIKVPGFVHPVREVYLDEAAAFCGWRAQQASLVDESSGQIDASKWFARGMDLTVAARLIHVIAFSGGLEPPPPTKKVLPAAHGECILVFLPGVPEIRKLARFLSSGRFDPASASTAALNDDEGDDDDDGKPTALYGGLHVLELHGGLTGEAQSRVFDPAPSGKIKVVLSTNVAETSVTIDGVTTVIDLGRVKETRYDALNRMSRLVETWCPLDSSDQRRGRAGRTRPGVCYRLFPESMRALVPAAAEPEMRRVALENLCLQIKAMQLGPIDKVLGDCLDPPHASSIRSAVTQLSRMGALSASTDHEDGLALTPLGQAISQLPVDVKLAKCLVFGAILSCLDPLLTIAASLSVRSPWVSPPDRREEAARAKEAFAWGHSDHLTMVRAFDAFRECRGYRARRSFCDGAFLSMEGMNTIESLREDFASVLADLGFLDSKRGALSPENNLHSKDSGIIRSALVAGLYPNLVKVVYPPATYVDTAGGSVRQEYRAQGLRMYTRPDEGVAAADEGSLIRFKGVAQQRVFLHPQSVCFDIGEYVFPWLIFSDKSETGKVFVRDATAATPYSLLLFGGDLTVHHHDGLIDVGEDSWTQLDAPGRVAVLARGIRRALDTLLQAKLASPHSVHFHTSDVVSLVVDLLRTGGMK
jgi:ATP-dependent RNA helicase DHX57